MQDLIERRAALTALCEDCKTKYKGLCPHPASRCVEFRTIKQLPAIEAAPVRHGRWIKSDDCRFKKCSECGEIWDAALCGNIFFIYCPRCGSKNGGADNG